MKGGAIHGNTSLLIVLLEWLTPIVCSAWIPAMSRKWAFAGHKVPLSSSCHTQAFRNCSLKISITSVRPLSQTTSPIDPKHIKYAFRINLCVAKAEWCWVQKKDLVASKCSKQAADIWALECDCEWRGIKAKRSLFWLWSVAGVHEWKH